MTSIQSYCRLCGALKYSDKLINLLEDSDAREEITRKLYRVNAVVDFTANILPQTACLVCISDLGRAFDFVFTVEKVQADLSEIFSEKIKAGEHLVCKEEGSIWEPEVEVQCQADDGDTLADLHSTSSVTFDEIEDVKPNKKLMKKSESPELKTSEYIENILFNPSENKPESSENTLKPTEQSQQSTEFDTCRIQEGPWKDFKWMCRFCDTEFTSREELNSHAMQFHDCCNPYRCSNCQLRVTSIKRFIWHIQTHPELKNLKYSCYICFKQYVSSKDTYRHLRKHYSIMKYFCKGCHAAFNDETELENHTKSYFKSVRQYRVKSLIDQTDGLTCLICQKTLKNKSSLNTHLTTHMDREKNNTCDTCGQSFFTKGSLQSHKVLHSDVRAFQCEICKAQFKTRATLLSHVGTHNSTTTFECKDCGLSFRHKRLLNSHRLGVHSAELTFHCKYCSKPFRQRKYLNMHLRQHTGVKPYSCSICNKDFTHWGNHNKHMKTRHGIYTAKKKHTSEGTFAIDVVTGKPLIPKKTEQMLEWKHQVIQPKKGGKLRKTCVSNMSTMENINN